MAASLYISSVEVSHVLRWVRAAIVLFRVVTIYTIALWLFIRILVSGQDFYIHDVYYMYMIQYG